MPQKPSPPGARIGPVRVHRAPPQPPAPTLAEAIQDAVESVVVGELLRPGLANSAKTAAMAVLHRRGIRGGHVTARIEGGGVALQIVVPAGPQRVERVVLNVGALS